MTNMTVEEFFNDSLNGRPGVWNSSRTIKYIMENKNEMAFYDPIRMKAENGEEYMLMVANATTNAIQSFGYKDGNKTKVLHLIEGKNYKYNELISPNMINNPITFAIHDTKLSDDEYIKRDGGDNDLRNIITLFLSGVDNYKDKRIRSVNFSDLDRDDSHLLFDNEIVVDALTFKDDTREHLTMPFIFDRHGNIFTLQSKYMNSKRTLLNVSKLLDIGIEAYAESVKEFLPILHKYIQDRDSNKFCFKNVREAKDIRNEKTFHEEFVKVYDQIRVKSRYVMTHDKREVDEYYAKKKKEGHIVRFEDTYQNSYIILPKVTRFDDDKKTIDIITGKSINELSVDNMYDFIQEDNDIYFISNKEDDTVAVQPRKSDITTEEVSENKGNIVQELTANREIYSIFVNHPKDGIFFYDLIYNDAMTPVIELYLYYIYAANNNETLYHEFTIRDNDGKGKKRVINAPNEQLKKISKKLNSILGKSVEKTVKNRGLDDVVIGYRKGKNIQDNALPHANNKRVVKADFKGYFDSIKLNMCADVFRFLAHPNKLDNYSETTYSNSANTYLSYINRLFELTHFNPKTGGLYMGNPISGALSNLVMVKNINFINNICKNKDITFTVYADDLTFSVPENTKDMRRLLNTEYIEYIIDHVLSENNMDYYVNINPDKTMVMKDHKRRITGIRLNSENELTWDRSKYREMRVLLHKLSNGTPLKELSMTRNELRGNLNFFEYTTKRNGELGDNNKIYKLIDKYREVLVRENIIKGE